MVVLCNDILDEFTAFDVEPVMTDRCNTESVCNLGVHIRSARPQRSVTPGNTRSC